MGIEARESNSFHHCGKDRISSPEAARGIRVTHALTDNAAVQQALGLHRLLCSECMELRADPNYLLFRGCGVLRGLDDGWRPAFFVPGIVSAAGDEISMSVNISSKARSAGPGGALARSWSP